MLQGYLYMSRPHRVASAIHHIYPSALVDIITRLHAKGADAVTSPRGRKATGTTDGSTDGCTFLLQARPRCIIKNSLLLLMSVIL